MSVLRTIDLGQYMDEVMEAATALNSDVAKDADRGFFASQQFLGPWEHFQEQRPYSIQGEPGAGGETVVPIPGNFSTSDRTAGLINFYERNRGPASRFVRTDEIWRRTGKFETELIKFYKGYREDGGTTTKTDPVEGFVPQDDEFINSLKNAGDKLEVAGVAVLAIGALIAVGYATNAVKR